jgi:hypothetical protein
MTITAQNYTLKLGDIQVVKVDNLQDTKDWLTSILPADIYGVVLREAMGGNIYVSWTTNGQQYGVVLYVGNFVAIDEDMQVFKVDADTLNLFFKPAA